MSCSEWRKLGLSNNLATALLQGDRRFVSTCLSCSSASCPHDLSNAKCLSWTWLTQNYSQVKQIQIYEATVFWHCTSSRAVFPRSEKSHDVKPVIASAYCQDQTPDLPLLFACLFVCVFVCVLVCMFILADPKCKGDVRSPSRLLQFSLVSCPADPTFYWGCLTHTFPLEMSFPRPRPSPSRPRPLIVT